MTPLENGKDACGIETKECRGPGAVKVTGGLLCSAATWHPDFYIQVKELEMIFGVSNVPHIFLSLKEFEKKKLNDEQSPIVTNSNLAERAPQFCPYRSFITPREIFVVTTKVQLPLGYHAAAI